MDVVARSLRTLPQRRFGICGCPAAARSETLHGHGRFTTAREKPGGRLHGCGAARSAGEEVCACVQPAGKRHGRVAGGLRYGLMLQVIAMMNIAHRL